MREQRISSTGNLWCINYSPVYILPQSAAEFAMRSRGTPGIETGMSKHQATPGKPINSPRQVLFASLIGTTIEFFDFYIYATAAVLVFPKLFFPASDPASATLASLATFGIAFLARPIGSALFGHFGDRIGRKTTLVVALSTMGLSTVTIGLLPTYGTIGFAAPLLLALCRFGQGLGLGGEWGGAVLLAIENAPAGKRAWYGMFPQLGAPIGFFLSGGVFLALSRWLTNAQFFAFGWRLPFLASAILVFLGLYVRLTITETPVFREALERREQVKVPMVEVFRTHAKSVAAGTMICIATFVLFYLMTVFALSWGTGPLGFGREKFLVMQLFCISFFALTIPVSAILAERGRRSTLMWITASIGVFGLVFAPIFSAGTAGAVAAMALGLSLMGLTYGPLGTVLSEMFPTAVRYTGSSLSFNFAGILGASLAPYIATYLAKNYGLPYVGYYLCASALLTLLGLLMIRETKDQDLAKSEA
jgi:metabolite-proton symporter